MTMVIRKGTTGDDYLLGSATNDVIWGKAGDDVIYGGAGADYLYGGDGDDLLNPLDDANLVTSAGTGVGEGADHLDGGSGFDTVDYSTAETAAGEVTRIDLANAHSAKGAADGDSYEGIEGVIGTRGDDQIYGTDDGNAFTGTWGHDSYDGRGGFDSYGGLAGDIIVKGKAIYDAVVSMTLLYGSAAQKLVGSDVHLAAGEAVASYQGFADANGNGVRDAGEATFSTYQLLTGIEEVGGSGGSDVLGGTAGDNAFAQSWGADRIDGGDGTDTLFLSAFGDGSGLYFGGSVDLGAGTAAKANGLFTDSLHSIENVIGSGYGDDILGSGSANLLVGRDGDDALNGAGGDDRLAGGQGDDVLIGGSGDDVLAGGAGQDMLDGGSGTDLVSYADAATSVAVNLLSGLGEVPIIGGTSMTAAPSIGDEYNSIENIDGSAHDDVIRGDTGANVLTGLDGGDLIYGCAGNDTIWGDADPARTLPSFAAPGDADTGGCSCCDDDDDGGDGDGAPDTGHADELHGGAGNDVVWGGLGSDLLYGDSGNDKLDGGTGTDIIYGGSGDDVMSGGAGFDFLFGGSGDDTITYAASGAGVTVDLSSFWNNSGGDAASDFVADVLAQLVSGDAADAANSSAFLSLIAALGSDDSNGAFSLALPDVTVGVENAIGSAYADTLRGDGGGNRLDGGKGDDLLAGAAGDDVLVGGAGLDRLTGGAGADRFVFDDGDTGRKASTADVITDFSHADGDRIDLSAIDAVSGGKDNPFKFIGSAAFDGHAGELRVYTDGGNSFVAMDTDGDKQPELLIELTGQKALVASDFVL